MLADKEKHVFKAGARFDTSFELYKFDRVLRLQILREIEKVEVAVRARVIYLCSHQYGPFWFMEPSHFRNPISHSKTLTNLSGEVDRSDEDFILAFKNKYSDPMPPSWMTFEVASFGSVSRLYQNLKPGRTRRAVAHSFGLNDHVFISWLHTLVYVRNVCAHHARLWNRTLGIIPEIPRTTHKQWLTKPGVNPRKVYFLLSMILYLHHSVNPHNTFAEKIKNLFKDHPNVDPSAMGFPLDYEKEPLWA